MGRTREGTTLLEMMVAFAIGGVAIATVALLLASVWRAASEGKYQAAASNLGRFSIEKMRGDPSYLSQIVLNTAPASLNTTLNVDGVVNTVFHSQISATQLSGTKSYYDVTVNVTWPQQDRIRSIVLETYICQP